MEKLESVTKLHAEVEQLRKEVKSLHEKNSELEFMIENLPGMGYSCWNDENWTMIFMSKGCIELTGYEPTDLIGNKTLSYNDIIHPDDRKHVWDLIQQAIYKKQKYKLLYRITTKSGQTKWVWEQGMGIFDPEGRLLQLHGFVKDVST